jgi:hypothetical protein
MNDVDTDSGRLAARNAGCWVSLRTKPSLPMSTESQLREKLRKIEALLAGGRDGGANGSLRRPALERVQACLAELRLQDPSIEMQFLDA